MPPTATTNGASGQVKRIARSYNPTDSEASARALVYSLLPEWKESPGDLEFVPFKDGITNTLFKAIKKRPGYNEEQIDDEAILLRAYGNGTDIIIDREREAHAHTLLSKSELAPPLLARFENGLLYKFIPGDPCNPEDLARKDVWPSTARLLGQWHATLSPTEVISASHESEQPYQNIIDLVPDRPFPSVWTILQKWIRVLPNKTDEERKRNAKLQRELEICTKRFGHTKGLSNGAYVACHCDLLCGNVIVCPKREVDGASNGHKVHGDDATVAIIDYEYITPGPSAFDLANHFAEYAGFDCDFNLIPSRSHRRKFLEQYVHSYRLHSKGAKGASAHGNSESTSSESAEVDQLFAEVDSFRGLPGLYWGIWGLIQAMISDIDFDYPTYADLRLGEYWAWKAEDEGRRASEGKEMPLRERKWAQES